VGSSPLIHWLSPLNVGRYLFTPVLFLSLFVCLSLCLSARVLIKLGTDLVKFLGGVRYVPRNRQLDFVEIQIAIQSSRIHITIRIPDPGFFKGIL